MSKASSCWTYLRICEAESGCEELDIVSSVTRKARDMSDQLPYYVGDPWAEILEPTPSGTRKFLAAWESLSNETRLRVLSERLSKRGPRFLNKKVLETALDSDSAFIRYLASRQLYLLSGAEENKLEDRVRSDPDPLVRYALSETSIPIGNLFSEKGAFLQLPHEERLAVVRELKGGGEAIANIVRDALGEEYNSKVSQLEIAEVVLDFLGSKNFKKHYGSDRYRWDGWAEYQRRRDLEALWLLVSDVPDLIATALLQHLPDFGELEESIAQITAKFDQWHWESVFQRAEIGLGELRVEKFFQCLAEEKRGVKSTSAFRMSCMMHNFYLLDAEFAQVLSAAEPLRKNVLTELATFGQQLPLHMMEAVKDALSSYERMDYVQLELARKRCGERLRSLSEGGRPAEIWKLRIYRFAREVVQWRNPDLRASLEPDIKFLIEKMVEGDSWATYQAFFDAIQSQPEKKCKVQRWFQEFQQLGDEFNEESDLTVEKEAEEEVDKQSATQELRDSVPANLVDARDVAQWGAGLETKIVDLEQKVFRELSSISDQLKDAKERSLQRTIVAWGLIACAAVAAGAYFLNKS